MLSPKALNRATLARQLLLERSDLPPLAAIEHLVGLQSQTPRTWYVGLWSRLIDFDPEIVSRLLGDREIVRIVLMRSTIHAVSAADCAALQPVMQAVSAQTFDASWARLLKGADLDALMQRGRDVFGGEPVTFPELGERLGEEFATADPAALGQAMRLLLPLVQVPPRGMWGRSGPIAHVTAEAWLGRPLGPAITAQELVTRYLAAFGPALPEDIEAWSGLMGLGVVIESMRPQLSVFRDMHGRDLFDLPEAPRPEPTTPVPVRFLYDGDNLLFGYADPARFLSEEQGKQMPNAPGAFVYGSVLVDGMVRAIWRVVGEGPRASMRIETLASLSETNAEAVEAEGQRLLAFLEPSSEGLVYMGALRWV